MTGVPDQPAADRRGAAARATVWLLAAAVLALVTAVLVLRGAGRRARRPRIAVAAGAVTFLVSGRR